MLSYNSIEFNWLTYVKLLIFLIIVVNVIEYLNIYTINYFINEPMLYLKMRYFSNLNVIEWRNND